MAAEPKAKAEAESGPYTGPNPFTPGSQAWHGWNYLKKTVDADRKANKKVDQLPEGWSHPDFDEHGKRITA